MNNKEFITELASRLGKTQKEVVHLVETSLSVMKDEFAKGNVISFQGFGALEVRKKEERITINPSSQKRMVVPPKLVLTFRTGSTLKEKLKEKLPNE
jgi:DNA-binding protein HU-beta